VAASSKRARLAQKALSRISNRLLGRDQMVARQITLPRSHLPPRGLALPSSERSVTRTASSCCLTVVRAALLLPTAWRTWPPALVKRHESAREVDLKRPGSQETWISRDVDLKRLGSARDLDPQETWIDWQSSRRPDKEGSAVRRQPFGFALHAPGLVVRQRHRTAPVSPSRRTIGRTQRKHPRWSPSPVDAITLTPPWPPAGGSSPLGA
jgi:hypothetical protein